MWIYEKKLQYPVSVSSTNPGLAKMLLSQYGGPYGSFFHRTDGYSFGLPHRFSDKVLPEKEKGFSFVGII